MNEPLAKPDPPNLSPEEFRTLGHELVDRIAEFYRGLPERAVTRDEDPASIRAALPPNGLPADGKDASQLLEETSKLLFEHSLHNGHPRFIGYITSSASPLGALGDLLVAAVNANVGLWDLAPAATEIEAQSIRWIAELIGYPTDCGGLMVSGGNMANLIGFFAARRAKASWDVRASGTAGVRLTLYASKETHTWIQKAADLAGLGTDAIRWVRTDHAQRMDVLDLERRVEADRAAGHAPFLVVGSAGTVSTGAVDPLPEIAALCAERGLWFHVDGAYGAPAAALEEAPAALRGLAAADSVALDPHKWLYSPLEAGCALVRSRAALVDAFSFHPDYYRLDDASTEPKLHYYEHGIQNSRGFRALKVWLAMRHAGRAGIVAAIRRNIALARRLFDAAEGHTELEARTQNLSLTTFRYVPADLEPGSEAIDTYLNALNEELLVRLQRGGEAFVSNAVVDGCYLLRACLVNFRTTEDDIDAIIDIVARLGRACDRDLRPA